MSSRRTWPTTVTAGVLWCIAILLSHQPGACQQPKIKYNRRPDVVASELTQPVFPAWAAAYSPHGDLLAIGKGSWSIHGKLTVWDTKTRKPVWAQWQTLGIRRIAFSDDGAKIATANYFGDINIYDRRGKQLFHKQIPGHAYAVSFSPDSKHVAAGGKSGELYVWDVATGERLETDIHHPHGIFHLAFADAGRVYTAGGDQHLRRWDLATSQMEQLFQGHTSAIEAVVVSSDHQTIATASWDQTIRLWRADGSLVRTLAGHRSQILSLTMRPDGKGLASGSGQWSNKNLPQVATVKLWNLDDEQPEGELAQFEATDKIFGIAFSPDASRLATATYEGKVFVWDTQTQKQLHELNEQDFATQPLAPLSIDIAPDGSRVAVAHEDGTVRLLDPSGTFELHDIDVFEEPVSCIDFSPDSRLLAASGYDPQIKLFDVSTGKSIGTLDGHTEWVLSLAFAPNGKQIATGSYDKSIRLWDIEQRKTVQVLEGHQASVDCVAFAPQGNLLASGSADHVLRLWRTSDGRVLWQNDEHSGAIRSVAFSHDGKYLASASDDKTIRIWAVEDEGATLVHRLVGHRDTIWSVQFSPLGGQLLSGSADGLVGVWDLDTGTSMMLQRRHTDAVCAVAFGKDASYFLSGGYDKQLFRWPKLDTNTAK